MAGRVSERKAAEVATAAEPPRPTPKQIFTSLLERNKGAIGLSLPRGMDQDRFVRLLLTATASNPRLLECDPISFLRAGVISAQLGLEPNDPRGEAYLIPYGKQVQFQIGYKGLMKLARRAGAAGFGADVVYTGDEFDWQQGTEQWLRHKRHGNDDPKAITHAWAAAKVDGEPEFVVMFRSQVDKIMHESQAYRGAERGKKDSPWHTNYDEMAIKTAIKRLCKKLPQNAELMHAIEVDDQSERGLVIEGVSLGDDDAIEAASSNGELGAGSDESDRSDESPSATKAPEGVDTATGEVIDATSSEPYKADTDAEPPFRDDAADDPERPF